MPARAPNRFALNPRMAILRPGGYDTLQRSLADVFEMSIRLTGGMFLVETAPSDFPQDAVRRPALQTALWWR
jgi:hypothetical protein